MTAMPGLFDGDFVGFRVPSDEDTNTALRVAAVAVDANILLGLYRYLPRTADDLLKVLERLGDRLIVPHQAVREFWRQRQRAAGSPEAATSTATEAIHKAEASVRQALEQWTKHVGLDPDERENLLAKSGDLAETLKQELADLHAKAGARTGGDDPILVRLEKLLDGRVTAALEEEEWKTCVEEGNRRAEAEEPPGYRDAGKQDTELPEGAAGDYLVWYQATRAAKERETDLVIVTADEKEDWWWRRQKTFVGPRPELTSEYQRLSGRRLFMLRPQDLLARAGALEVEIDQDSLADADRAPEPDPSPAAWTADALLAVLKQLDGEAPVQAKAIRTAARQGGRVTREEIYALGNYSEQRMLRGFTRPPLRVTAALQAAGVVSENVRPIFAARYPEGVKASYFTVPPEVPALYAELEGD
jgi:hypothetical protein